MKSIFIVMLLTILVILRQNLTYSGKEISVESIDTENEQSVDSLSYALHRLQNQQMAEPTTTKNTLLSFADFQLELRGTVSRPELFAAKIEERLKSLTDEELNERTLLLDEAFSGLQTQKVIFERILEEEKGWVSKNISFLKDKATLDIHVQKLTQLTIRSVNTSESRIEAIKKFATQVKSDPYALRAVQRGLIKNSELDITDIFGNIPEDLKVFLVSPEPPEVIPSAKGPHQ